MVRLICFTLLLLFAPGIVSANVMFEGYSVIEVGSARLGFVVQRYEFDDKKKQFTSTYLIKTKDVTESLKAVANDKFQPISYQYTSKTGDQVKMIDAKFKNNMMVGTIGDGKTSKKISRKLEGGVFLSSFLGYLMLQKGIGVGKNFVYKAVAEEDGEVFPGEAWIKEETQYNGHKAYKIENKFKNSGFTSFVTPRGEVLATASDDSNLRTELKSRANDATSGFVVPTETLKILFGSVPVGATHSLAKVVNGKSAVQSQPQTTDLNSSSGP